MIMRCVALLVVALIGALVFRATSVDEAHAPSATPERAEPRAVERTVSRTDQGRVLPAPRPAPVSPPTVETVAATTHDDAPSDDRVHLASGRVVDADGAAWAAHDRSGLRIEYRSTGPVGVVRHGEAAIGADGSFVVRGAVVPSPLTLRVTGRADTRSSSRDVAVGSTGLRLVVRRVGRVRGTLRAPSALAPTVFGLEFRAGGRRIGGDMSCTAGDFSFIGAPVGPIVARVRLGEVLVAERVLTAHAFDETRSTREVIDLRGAVRVVRIRVIDPTGQPIHAAAVTDTVSGRRDRTNRDGVVSLASTGTVDARIAATGYRTRALRVFGGETITLASGIDARLRLECDEPGAFVGAGMMLRVTHERDTGGPGDVAWRILSERSVDWRFPDPGRYRIRATDRIDGDFTDFVGTFTVADSLPGVRQEIRVVLREEK